MKLTAKEGGVHVSMSDLETNSSTTNSKNDPNKKRYSQFFLTVNTNYRPKNDAESQEVGYELRDAMRGLRTEANLEKIFRTDSGSVQSKVSEMDIESVIEIGQHPKGQRIHGHATFDTTHTGDLKMNFGEIKRIILEEMNDDRVKGLYINVRMMKHDKYIKDYLRKKTLEREAKNSND